MGMPLGVMYLRVMHMGIMYLGVTPWSEPRYLRCDKSDAKTVDTNDDNKFILCSVVERGATSEQRKKATLIELRIVNVTWRYRYAGVNTVGVLQLLYHLNIFYIRGNATFKLKPRPI